MGCGDFSYLALAVISTNPSPNLEDVNYDWALVNANPPYSVRDGAAMIEFNGKAWLFGGWNADGVTNDIWSSDDAITWQSHGHASWPKRHAFNVLKFQNKLWVVGGDFYTDVWNSNDGYSWNLISNGNPWGERYSPYTCVFKDSLWVMGGETLDPMEWERFSGVDQNVTGFNDVWKSTDGVNWTRVQDVAPWSPRGLIHGCISTQEKMYILGGGLKAGNASTTMAATVTEYNDIWETEDGINWVQTLSDAPWSPRTHFSVISHNNKFYITDGSVQRQINLSNEVWVSDNMKDWTQLAHSPFSPRHASSLFEFKNSLYIANGYLVNDIWVLKE